MNTLQKLLSGNTVRHLADTIRRCHKTLRRYPRTVSAVALGVLCLGMVLGVSAGLTRITVQDGTHTCTVLSLSHSPAAVLSLAGIPVYREDIVTADMTGADKHITIRRAFEVKIADSTGKSTTVRMTGGTAANALALAGVDLDQYSITNAEPKTWLSKGATLEIERLEQKERSETTPVPFETVITFSDKLGAGERRTVTKGVDGTKNTVYRDYLQNETVVRTETVSETVTVAPITEVVEVGNGALSVPPADLELDADGNPKTYARKLTGTACAYTANPGARTSLGATPQIGTVAINPAVIPYGSHLYIKTPDGSYVYGYGVAQDTGGGVLRNDILADLYMNTVSDCYQFGRRKVDIYILK